MGNFLDERGWLLHDLLAHLGFDLWYRLFHNFDLRHRDVLHYFVCLNLWHEGHPLFSEYLRHRLDDLPCLSVDLRHWLFDDLDILTGNLDCAFRCYDLGNFHSTLMLQQHRYVDNTFLGLENGLWYILMDILHLRL